MKIAQLKLWRFRCFGSSDPAADGKPKALPIEVTLEGDITALIGRNGSGKSALLLAMQRLFGETREERLIRSEDFFVAPGETLKWCQSAFKFDPRSASNFDPLERRVLAVALAPSELVGVAETARARVGG